MIVEIKPFENKIAVKIHVLFKIFNASKSSGETHLISLVFTKTTN